MGQKEALYWKRIKEDIVQCQLCPHFCFLKEDEMGKCGVRQNKEGILRSLSYEKPCSIAVDPIEKKPLYHFLPSQKTLSIATPGCNLKCKFCQNWEISQAKIEEYKIKEVSPEEIINEAIKNKCKIISYTYTEPTVFYEYMIDIAKKAKKRGIKNVIVSNGFINPEPLNELCRFIDGANIDLKSINPKFYLELCGADLKPVINTIKTLIKNKVWTEVTTLIIPGKNDSEEEIKKLSKLIKSIDCNIPLHFSAFYPCYQMMNVKRTSAKILNKAREVAIKEGLRYVYTGNIIDEKGSATYCLKCKKGLIKREGFDVVENKLNNGFCSCGEKIAGVWG
ncbi:MAG: AmmeMemoRadiSam system radical SAM enzyme [archaeon]